METKYTTLIERYFDQQLSSEELAKVEQLKKTDTDFQEEFELFEKAHQAVKMATVIELKEQIREIHHNMDVPKNRGVITFSRVGIAASILICLALGFYAQQFSNENLYSEAYTPVGDYITNMDNEISELEKAMSLFDEQEYEHAAEAFNKIYATANDEVALFYLGQSYYQANQMKLAIKHLSEVSGSYKPESQWYIALAYLKTGKDSMALKTLNSIVEDNQDQSFVLKAQTLKNKLQSPFRKLVF